MELSLGTNDSGRNTNPEPSIYPSDSRTSFSSQSLDSSRSCSLSSAHSSNLRNHRKKHDILAKLILLGESTVGKSCLTNRYVNDEFDFNSIATVGMDLRIKVLDLDGKVLKVQIWDTAGQERYRATTKAFHRGANGVVFVYDITNLESFMNLRDWITEFDKSTSTSEAVPKVVIGNKVDLDSKRAVEYSDAKEFCDFWEIPYFETSAKTGSGVMQAFDSINRRAALHAAKKSEKKKELCELERQKRRRCTNCIIS